MRHRRGMRHRRQRRQHQRRQRQRCQRLKERWIDLLESRGRSPRSLVIVALVRIPSDSRGGAIGVLPEVKKVKKSEKSQKNLVVWDFKTNEKHNVFF